MRLPAHRRRPGHLVVLAIAVLAAVAVTTFPASAQDGTQEWTSDGTATWFAPLNPDWDDINVRSGAGGLSLNDDPAGAASIRTSHSQGMLLTPAHRLAEPSNQVAAELVADRPAGSTVDVDVRGTRPDGSWTEWVPASTESPAVLDSLVTTVQTRVMLRSGEGGASPRAKSIRLTAQTIAQTLLARPRSPLTYRVFATREGLVGGITANGHVIRERDHFVALPSRRALAPRGSGDYTVKVCSDRGRCEWAPVWDVGPWNTTDDYWNSPASRQSWNDLPQGRPQAQAAYHDGHNASQDQFGRQVRNPAGIDLADGTFWDGLGLHHNSWVTVTYMWTTGRPPAIVRVPLLHVRSGPGRHFAVVGLAVQRATLPIECSVTGPAVNGSQGRTDRWLRVGLGQFVSAAHVSVPDPGDDC